MVSEAIFLRSREEEVGQFAALHLGSRDRIETVRLPMEQGTLISWAPVKRRVSVLICPPGTLGRLPPHQGYATVPGGRAGEHPLWFVPWFEESQELDDPASTSGPRALIRAQGFTEALQEMALDVVLDSLAHEVPQQQTLEQARAFFRSRAVRVPEGLEGLPGVWLKALPGHRYPLRAGAIVVMPEANRCAGDGLAARS